LEPIAVREANQAAGLRALPEQLVARSDFLEVGGGYVEIESEVYSGVLRRAKRTVTAVKRLAGGLSRLTFPYICASKSV